MNYHSHIFPMSMRLHRSQGSMWLSYQVNEMNGYVLSTTIHTYTVNFAFFLSIALEYHNPQWYKVITCNCLVQKE